MLHATIKDLLARKLRLVTTSAAVLLGVAFLAGTLVLTDTLGATFDDLFADVYAGTDAHVRSADVIETDFGESERAGLDEALVDTVAGVDGVAAAAGFVEGYAQLVGPDSDPLGGGVKGAPTFGFNWIDDPDLNPFALEAGDAPAGPGEVVLDAGSATETGYGVGDTVTVLTAAGPAEATVSGVATFGSIESPGGSSVMLFDTATAQDLFGRAGLVDSVDAVAAEGVSEQELTERIAATAPDGVEVLTGAEITAEEQSEIAEAFTFLDTFLLVFAAVALFVGAFIIYNTFSIIVAQRSKEMALLRAIGASRRQVLGSVLVEAVLVGLIASAVGLLAGLGVATGLKSLLAGFGIDLPSTGLVVAPATVIGSFVVGVGVSVGSALFPARRAGKVAPIAALRDVAVDTSGRSTRRAATGLAILGLGGVVIAGGLLGGEPAPVGLGAAVVFVGVAVLGPVIAGPLTRVIGAPLPPLRGMTGSLARENALRNPKRTSATAAALMIGVGLIGFITVFASSTKTSVEALIGENFTGDVVIDSGSFGFGGAGLPPEVADRLAEVPEVEVAGGIRFLPAVIDGDEGAIQAFDPALAEVLRPGRVTGSFDDLGATGVAVHDLTAEEEGLELGDDVPIAFAATGEQRFTVGAIYTNDDFTGDYLLTNEAATAADPAVLDVAVYVGLAEGTSLEEALPAITSITDDYANAEVLDLDEFVASQTEQVDQILNLVYVLLALAVVIALLGIANTLALSIFERTRELGLLRAVGMTRGQLRSAVRWESVIIALLGTFLGLVIGLGFSRALVAALGDEGITIYDVPVGQLVVIAIIAAVAGVAAALLPARRAARLDVLRAIAAE